MMSITDRIAQPEERRPLVMALTVSSSSIIHSLQPFRFLFNWNNQYIFRNTQYPAPMQYRL
jgi:hypothetical protein